MHGILQFKIQAHIFSFLFYFFYDLNIAPLDILATDVD